ncbi:50S ribosomal protein L13 [Candidatus Woesearchaeota archaeon]|nr:MAG: 50S ribosomal protein L13, large subunit ribosomal protein L13 [archaeon GW2011_AR18]MBS3161966.1 50S ribosomal protein L13 [Candidatus Woesearchaeota archaeon]HIH25834.1 50S ribosomal protein L13 [Nanoarchaeota archaeon]
MIIDGTNLVLGRLASFAAKKSLDGEEVIILNCEKVVISGRKVFLLESFKAKHERGHPYHGPFYPKMADRIVRRSIRGMLPYKQQRGVNAFKKVQCFLGVPVNYQGKKFDKISLPDASKFGTLNYLKLNDVSKHLGSKHVQ